MNSVFLDFQTRSGEVESYFRFVIRLAGEELALKNTESGESAYSTHEHDELLKTLKATFQSCRLRIR